MKPALLMLAAGVLMAQSEHPKHNVTMGLGAGMPRGDLTPFFSESLGVTANYGYRFHRYFQADAGLDVLFGAAGVKDFYPSEFGYLRIRDYQWLVPLGGRAILPLARGRVLLAGGGGAAYMRYTERIRQPSSYFRIDCPVCSTRGGWGSYALLSANIFPSRYSPFRIGAGAKVYRGHTTGDSLGSVPGIRTRDHWVNIFAEIGISF